MNGWRFWYGCFVVYINVSCCTKCGHVSRFLSSVRWICCVKCQIRGMETRWLDLTLMDLPWNCKRLAVRRACVRRSGHVRGLFMSVCLWEQSSESSCQPHTHRPDRLSQADELRAVTWLWPDSLTQTRNHEWWVTSGQFSELKSFF